MHHEKQQRQQQAAGAAARTWANNWKFMENNGKPCYPIGNIMKHKTAKISCTHESAAEVTRAVYMAPLGCNLASVAARNQCSHLAMSAALAAANIRFTEMA